MCFPPISGCVSVKGGFDVDIRLTVWYNIVFFINIVSRVIYKRYLLLMDLNQLILIQTTVELLTYWSEIPSAISELERAPSPDPNQDGIEFTV